MEHPGMLYLEMLVVVMVRWTCARSGRACPDIFRTGVHSWSHGESWIDSEERENTVVAIER